jgi:hypothetical protein
LAEHKIQAMLGAIDSPFRYWIAPFPNPVLAIFFATLLTMGETESQYLRTNDLECLSHVQLGAGHPASALPLPYAASNFDNPVCDDVAR